MTTTELLLDALEYYTVDPKNRRCVLGLSCRYHPSSISKEGTSEGCLIGRLLPEELALELDEKNLSIYTVFHHDDYIPLRKRVEKIDPVFNAGNAIFLSNCQTLHDSNIYWGKTGLTSEGKERLSRILNDYISKEDHKLFKKYYE